MDTCDLRAVLTHDVATRTFCMAFSSVRSAKEDYTAAFLGDFRRFSIKALIQFLQDRAFEDESNAAEIKQG